MAGGGRYATDHLIVTDLDGTLLRSDRSLSEYTVRVLRAAIAAGVGLTYATARSHHTASPLLTGVGLRLPAVVFNGALAVDPGSGDRLAANLLDRDLATAVVAEGLGCKLPPIVCGFTAGSEVAVHADPVNEGQRLWLEQRVRHGDPRLRHVPVVRPPDEVLVVQFIARREDLHDLTARVRSTFGERVATALIRDVYQPDYYHFEIHHPRATKGQMVRWVADRVGVPLGAVTAIGDNHNDLSMFGIAARRLAVGNAQPEVLAVADEVLATNDEDGVAAYLDARFGLTEGRNGGRQPLGGPQGSRPGASAGP